MTQKLLCKKIHKILKKQISVLANFILLTDNGKKMIRVPYIKYLIYVHQDEIQALLDTGSKVNAIIFDFAWKLDLKVQKINV